jgi:NADH-quinone oxidoreductase subunit J
MFAAALVEKISWGISAIIVLSGALGVVILENPVHNALSLVATLFGVAVMFVIEKAYFLAAIQIIVYAGAIVVLFLFVIMLLGVDRFEIVFGPERKAWRRPLAYVAGAAIVGLVAVGLLATKVTVTGQKSVTRALGSGPDINQLGKTLFTKYIWAFEITGVLLTVAVVGAVVLSRRLTGAAIDLDEFPPDPEELDIEPEPEPEPESVPTGSPTDAAVVADQVPEPEAAS